MLVLSHFLPSRHRPRIGATTWTLRIRATTIPGQPSRSARKGALFGAPCLPHRGIEPPQRGVRSEGPAALVVTHPGDRTPDSVRRGPRIAGRWPAS